MRRWLATLFVLLSFLAASRPAESFLYVRGGNGRSGDLIGVWVKNGFELVLNLGPVEGLGFGQVKSFAVPTQFGGDLSGAKFTALTVPDPTAVFGDLGLQPPPPQYNVALTTLGDPETITFQEVGDAQGALDPPLGGMIPWLNLLNTIPAAGGADVIENSDSRLVMTATYYAAYSTNLGFSSDAIGNKISLSTAVVVDPEETGADYQIPLYTDFQTLTPQNGDFVFGTQVTQLGVLDGDFGGSGSSILSLQEAPEPAAVAVGAAALAVLGGLRRRRRG
jgi:hypothetical protein